MAGITVNQTPVSIAFECDWCDAEIEMPYNDCVKKYGDDPYDWERVECPECGHEVGVDYLEFD